MMATTQVKRAIAKMCEAGFARSEFRCQVERRRVNGGTEYGDAKVTIWRKVTEQEIDNLLDVGFDVTVYYRNDQYTPYPLIKNLRNHDDQRGRLTKVLIYDDGRPIQWIFPNEH